MPARRIELSERLLAKRHEDERGCWIWTGCRDKDGYGGVQVNRQKMRAHRVSYELHVGPIPEGMVVCHHCDTPSCINPAHLFVGAVQDNNLDKFRKGRHSYGEGHGRAKLDVESVKVIRSLKGIRLRDIAAIFDVSPSMIGYVRSGENWRCVA